MHSNSNVGVAMETLSSYPHLKPGKLDHDHRVHAEFLKTITEHWLPGQQTQLGDIAKQG